MTITGEDDLVEYEALGVIQITAISAMLEIVDVIS
jgi:hypothetical protein